MELKDILNNVNINSETAKRAVEAICRKDTEVAKMKYKQEMFLNWIVITIIVVGGISIVTIAILSIIYGG